MFGLVDSLTRRLVRRGVRRWLAEGSVGWIVVAVAAWVVRLLLSKEPDNVIREKLRVGETLIVEHLPAPPSRRQRRRLHRGTADASR